MAPNFLSRLKSLSATPAGLLTLQSGRDGIDTSAAGAFQGSSFFGFPRSSYLDGYFYSLQNASYAYMWQTQPNVRSVVKVLADNFAQVPCVLYKKVDGQPQPDETHAAAATLLRPNDWQTDSEVLEGLASDYLIFGNAYLVKIRPAGSDTVTLLRIPAYAMGVRGANRLKPDGYRIVYADGTGMELTPEEVIHWRGYNALDPRTGWAPMENLRQELIGESMRMAADIEFSRGGRVKGGIIERPSTAPGWGEKGRNRFEEGWSARAKGLNGGRSVVLEDDMKWVDAGVTPREAELIESRQLSLAVVCHVYSIHPSVLGVYASEQNLAEGRKQLYEDVLPPLFKRCSGVLTRGLVEQEYNDTTHFFDFDLREKLAGNLVERMEKAVAAGGAAFMTRDEIRAGFGLKPLGGRAAELITPLNVLVGNMPAPNVMPPNHATGGLGNEAAPGDVPNPLGGGGKAVTPELIAHRKALAAPHRSARKARMAEYTADVERVMRRHFNRQSASLQGKATTPPMNTARWNTELAAELKAAKTRTIQREGEVTAARMMGTFDMSRVENWIANGAEYAAKAINDSTQAEIEARRAARTLKDDAGNNKDAQDVLDVAASSRATEIARTMTTRDANFATNEAGETNQQPGQIHLKEWVWSGAANSRHGGLAGEVALVGDTFSNGMLYPGDAAGGIEECANCLCDLEIL